MNLNFHVMRFRWFNLTGSLLLMIGLLVFTFQKYGGFALSIDFAGGIKLELTRVENLTLDSLRTLFEKEKINALVQLVDKTSGDRIKIEIGGNVQQDLTRRAAAAKDELTKANYPVNAIDYTKYLIQTKLLPPNAAKIEFSAAEQVGPTVGKYMQTNAIYLVMVALILISVYVALRFRFNFALGALLSSLHDLVITMGVIGVLQIPLSVPVIAALLTILGYSINDTIVIFDRIRENIHGKEDIGIEHVVDKSIMQSLTRTINTTTTTFIAIFPIYLLGDDSLKDLAEVLLYGILIGTYSSNFVAAPIVVIWDNLMKRRRAS
ncbi:MAG TPA: protein translocase subunit SecF [Turneriella sp.]|nr:protein translocase subunit SecF [Turneriella sp.]